MASSKEEKAVLALYSLACQLIDDLRDFGSENVTAYEKQLGKIIKDKNK
jgi:hypothetical protein